jgi:chromosome segregation ATPase
MKANVSAFDPKELAAKVATLNRELAAECEKLPAVQSAESDAEAAHTTWINDPKRSASTTDRDRSIELHSALTRAVEARKRIEARITDLENQIRGIKPLAEAKVTLETTRNEHAEIVGEIATKQARRTALEKTCRDLRLEINEAVAKGERNLEAAVERDLAARAAGKAAPIAEALKDFEVEQNIRRGSLAAAERMLAGIDSELKALRERLQSVAAQFYVAKHNTLRLRHLAALAELAPLLTELEAARRLAGRFPDEPQPLNDIDVRHAMQTIAAELPAPPPDVAEPSDEAPRAPTAVPSALAAA